MNEPIRIALVDDHNLFRTGLASIIKDFKNYTIIFEASDGEEMIRKIDPQFKPHIIILDINMPRMNGLSTTLWLRDNYPDINIMVLSMFSDAEIVLALVALGVKCYLLKDTEPKEFENALHHVTINQTYFPEFVTNYLVLSINTEFRIVKLNKREREFLKLIATELTYKEIAEQMCLSKRTVEGYRDQLFEKLAIKNRIGLLLYAIKHKLVDL